MTSLRLLTERQGWAAAERPSTRNVLLVDQSVRESSQETNYVCCAQTVTSVRLLTEQEGWSGLPLFAWGGCAGGSFAVRLPYFLPMKVEHF